MVILSRTALAEQLCFPFMFPLFGPEVVFLTAGELIVRRRSVVEVFALDLHIVTQIAADLTHNFLRAALRGL